MLGLWLGRGLVIRARGKEGTGWVDNRRGEYVCVRVCICVCTACYDDKGLNGTQMRWVRQYPFVSPRRELSATGRCCGGSIYGSVWRVKVGVAVSVNWARRFEKDQRCDLMR